jgi:uncharacterized protein YdgA (DUF945 family)
MHKAVVAAAFVAVVVVGTWMGVALWSGSQATRRLEAQASEWAALSPHAKLVKQQTSSGLFSSTHEATLQLGCLPPSPGQTTRTPLLVSVRSVVHHGPLPGGGLGVATIDSELLTPSVWRADVEKLIGKQPPLRAHTRVGIRGDVVSQLTLAGVRFHDPEQGGFRSEPVRAELSTSALPDDQGNDSYVLDIPTIDLTVSGPDSSTLQVKVGRVLGELVLGKRVEPKLWLRPQQTTAFVTSVSIDGSVAGAPGKPAVRSRASWDGIKLTSASTLAEGMLTSQASWVTRGKVNDFAIDKVELSSSLKNLDAAALSRVLDALFGATLSCEGSARAPGLGTIVPALQKELSALIVHNPELAVDNFEIYIGDKRAKLAYSAGTSDIVAADRETPVLLLLAQKGFLRGKLQVHMGLVELLANKLVNYDSKPSQQTSLARTSGIVKGVVDNFIRQGYLERAGEEVRVSAAFEHGQLLINGKPRGVPPLSLPSLEPPPEP